jgi:uncharacterized protein YecT (DUF1311 family)
MHSPTRRCFLRALWASTGFLPILAGSASFAAEPARRQWLWYDSVVYQENHDPGVIVLQDRRRITVRYDVDLAWKDVDAWKPGRRLAFAFDAATGPVLVDVATGRLMPVVSGWKVHPLDAYLDRRPGKEGSTLDMVEWSAEAERMWKAEMTRIHRVLVARATPAVKARLEAAQQRWEKYREAEAALITAIDTETEGTIGRVIAAGRHLALVRNRALHLYTYQED